MEEKEGLEVGHVFATKYWNPKLKFDKVADRKIVGAGLSLLFLQAILWLLAGEVEETRVISD